MENNFNDRTQELATGKIGPLLFAYALPSVISQVIASVYNIADRAFLGHCVGPLAIAGLAITMPLMNVIHACGSLVGLGAGVRMSIVLGRGDKVWAEKILGNSLVYTLVLGALILVFGYAFLDRILCLFGASADTIAYAREYMRILLPGMVMTTVTFNLTALIRSCGYPRKSMWILVGGAVLNIVLDALFIPVFGWGIAGAAWATTITMGLTAIVSTAHFIRPSEYIRFRSHAWKFKGYILKNVTMIGLSPCLMNLASSAVVALLNSQLIRHGGDMAVGVYGIVNTFGSFTVMIIIGICQGMQPIAGYNYGACRTDRLKEVYSLAMKFNVGISTVISIVCILCPRVLMKAFTTDETMLDMGEPAMRYLMCMWPLIAFTINNSNFFLYIDKPLISIVTSLSRQVIFLIPAIYVIPRLFISSGLDGLDGVWFSCTCSDVFGAILAAVFLYAQRTVFRPGYVPVHKQRREAGPDGENQA